MMARLRTPRQADLPSCRSSDTIPPVPSDPSLTDVALSRASGSVSLLRAGNGRIGMRPGRERLDGIESITDPGSWDARTEPRPSGIRSRPGSRVEGSAYESVLREPR